MKMGGGTEKKYYSGVWVPHPTSDKLMEILNNWSWYTGTDLADEDNEIRFRCSECNHIVFSDTQKDKLTHLVINHGYNMDGSKR